MLTLRVIVAGLHLVALGLGMGAVLTRGNALREPVTDSSLRRALSADALWGIAALLWVITGLWRLFGGFEKGTEYYFTNLFFHAKMSLFLAIVLLEIWPATTLTKWRFARRRGAAAETIVNVPVAKRIATISHVQSLLVLLMIFAAAAMARGFGVTD
jgi:putative membrane protein